MDRARHTKRRARGGMTLIESVMLIVVMSIALPPMLATIARVTRDNVAPECRVIAMNLVRDKVEELIHIRHDKGYGDSALNTGTSTESPVSGFSTYTRTVQISEASQRKTVTVTVSWSGGSLNAATVFSYF